MKQYEITINGLTPLLMHQDNIYFSEKIDAWRKDPANKGKSSAGDDRTPAWTWIGYLYHDTVNLGMPSDNLMTMLREGGTKVVKKGKLTFKAQTQSGIMIDQQQFKLLIGGKPTPIAQIKELVGNNDFSRHEEVVKNLGFELNVKRAKIGRAKHIRVRPMFRDWQMVGSLTVLDEELSGITKPILQTILDQAGALCGLGDWRPSSGSSGSFGKFEAVVKKV